MPNLQFLLQMIFAFFAGFIFQYFLCVAFGDQIARVGFFVLLLVSCQDFFRSHLAC